MAARFEEDEEDSVNDGFHFDDPNDPNYGQERVISDVFLDEGEDRFLTKELKKLNEGDQFAEIPFANLDKNAKRRATRMVKRFQGKTGEKTKQIEIETINGYDFYRLAYPPYNLNYLTDLSVEDPTHSACIRTKVINIVGLGYKWEETEKVRVARMNAQEDDSKMEFLARKLQRVTTSLDEWLEDMNEDETFTETLIKVWTDLEATGNGYLEVGRNRAGRVAYIGHIPSKTMRVRVDRDGFVHMPDYTQVIFFRNFGDTTTPDPFHKDDRPNEIIHFKKHTAKNNYYGIPDIIAALTAVAGEKFSAEYNLDYFENKAVPRYALIIKGAKLTAQAERRILDYFRKEVKGKHHGTLYIPVPAPMGSNVDVQLTAIENKIQDGSFVKYRQENKAEIMMAHQTPPSKLAIESGVTSGSARDADKTFKVQVVRPGQKYARNKMNLIVKEQTDMYLVAFEEYDLVDEETKSRIHDRYLRNGTISANEVRGEIRMHPRRGGDKYVDLAAESEANVYLREQQGDAATMMRTPTPGNVVGGKSGAKRQTLDGGKNTPGSTKTPASSTPTGGKARGQAIDQNGPRSRDR